MNGTDRYDDRFEWIVFAAGDCLQRVDNFGRKHDRIFRFVRVGAVSTDTAHGDVNRIDIRVSRPFSDPDVTDLEVGFVMKAERKIGFAEAVVKTSLEQRPR